MRPPYVWSLWPEKWTAASSSPRRPRQCFSPARDRSPPPSATSLLSRDKIETFDYQGVRLLPSRWKSSRTRRATSTSTFQRRHPARLPPDAGLPAPGRSSAAGAAATAYGLRPVAERHVAPLSRHRRRAHARQGRRALERWAKTVKPDGDAGMRHYPSTSWCAASSICSSTPTTRRRSRCSRR